MSKNVNGIAVNGLGYTGIVRISQCTGRKKVLVAEMHNEGGRPLFDFLADCLVDDFDIAKLNRPNKILLLKENDSGELQRAGGTDFIYLLAKPEKVYSEENESIVRYSFIIPQEYFNGTGFNAIGLYGRSASAADVERYAACCKVDTSEWNLSISSVLVLDWELHISN